MFVSDLEVDSVNMSLKIGAQPKGRLSTAFAQTAVLSSVHCAMMFAVHVSSNLKSDRRSVMSLLVGPLIFREP